MIGYSVRWVDDDTTGPIFSGNIVRCEYNQVKGYILLVEDATDFYEVEAEKVVITSINSKEEVIRSDREMTYRGNGGGSSAHKITAGKD